MTKQFKSERAAKLALTKAEKAWEAARANVGRVNDESLKGGHYSPDHQEGGKVFEARKIEASLFAAYKATYDAAIAQGFSVWCYEFGCNPTRDLIAANMD